MQPMFFTLQPPPNGDPTGIFHAEHPYDEAAYSWLGLSQTQREEMVCTAFSSQNTIWHINLKRWQQEIDSDSLQLPFLNKLSDLQKKDIWTQCRDGSRNKSRTPRWWQYRLTGGTELPTYQLSTLSCQIRLSIRYSRGPGKSLFQQ